MQTIVRHRSTVEYLDYTFESVTVDGAQVDAPTTYQLAAVPVGEQPDDATYHTAPWLAGPMTPGDYDVYLRFTDESERPAVYVAQLRVT